MQTFEMETYLLNHLAEAANVSASVRDGLVGKIRTGAVQMVFANRVSGGFITPDEVALLENWSGRAVCEGLVAVEIPDDVSEMTILPCQSDSYILAV